MKLIINIIRGGVFLKDLPRVYQNKIDHDINNDQKSYASFSTNNNFLNNKRNISKKDIDNILLSRNHIYGVNVKIKTKDGEYITKIISRKDNHVITIDNKKIFIDDITNLEEI